MYEKYLDTYAKIVKKIIPLHDKPIIVEIGARDCIETLGLRKNFPDAHIYTFECNPDTLPQCRQRVANDPNITLIEKAVTDKDGTVSFFKINNQKTRTDREGGNSGASSIFEANTGYVPETYVQDKITVPSITLKTFVNTHHLKYVDIMWLNMQGAELMALRSAGDFLKKVSIINTETEFFPIYKNQPLFKDLRAFMNSQGFRVYTFTAIGKYACDVVFVNKEMCTHRFLLPEGIIIFWHRGKEKVVGKMRGLRFKTRTLLKKIINSSNIIKRPAVYINALAQRIRRLLTERPARKAYYDQIALIKKNKRIVVDLTFGGIGDCLVYSTLPELLKTTYDVDFYLTEKSRSIIRDPNTYKLCFEMNPYFKGTLNVPNTETFRLQQFEREQSLRSFITDKHGMNLADLLEKQFNLKGQGRPKLYYKPKKIPSYEHIVLIDKNFISGKKFDWKFRKDIFEIEARKHLEPQDTLEYVDVSKQDLFAYVDMIYSAKYFVATFSGGASIAACFDKPFTVVWPYNQVNNSNYQFLFKNSNGYYTP